MQAYAWSGFLGLSQYRKPLIFEVNIISTRKPLYFLFSRFRSLGILPTPMPPICHECDVDVRDISLLVKVRT